MDMSLISGETNGEDAVRVRLNALIFLLMIQHELQCYVLGANLVIAFVSSQPWDTQPNFILLVKVSFFTVQFIANHFLASVFVLRNLFACSTIAV